MAFDVDKMLADCTAKLTQFALEHPTETFYAFAIDAGMLCLNSNEDFAASLQEYQTRWERQTRPIDSLADLSEVDWRDEELMLNIEVKCNGLDRKNDEAVLQVINRGRARQRAKGCDYFTEAGIKRLRDNTGDWGYQGFANLDEEHGYDAELYQEHYYAAMDSDEGQAPQTAYALAMTELVERLRSNNAFTGLKRTNDFAVTWVDHDY